MIQEPLPSWPAPRRGVLFCLCATRRFVTGLWRLFCSAMARSYISHAEYNFGQAQIWYERAHPVMLLTDRVDA